MRREEEVRRAVREAKVKRPATKVYIAIFLVLAAVLSVYLLLNFMTTSIPTEPGTGAVQTYDVASAEEAQQTSDYINNGAQESFNDIDGMGAFLGI